MSKKKIAICHYRVGGTDGVSLEIKKRKEILEKSGCEVRLIAGNQKADRIIEELEWDWGAALEIKENAFKFFKKSNLNESALKNKIESTAKSILNQLNQIHEEEKFDHILVHNIFSFGGHISAAKAFALWMEQNNLPVLATHHDFYWERHQYREPRFEFIKKYIQSYMPPKSENIRHITINSIAKEKLFDKRGIRSEVTPDIFDFNQPNWIKDQYNNNFYDSFGINPKSLVVLQATRILPRKGIEMAVDFTAKLQKAANKLAGKTIYNGKSLGNNPEVVLMLAGYAEEEDQNYLDKLRKKIAREGINAKFISDRIHSERELEENKKIFSLWDAYVYADIITFPSLWEGWGNQFIEAIFARQPVVVFEYPVFKSDIRKEGYKVISFEDKVSCSDKYGLCKLPGDALDKSVNESIDWLLDKNLHKKLEWNFKTGKKYHDFSVLKKFLSRSLSLPVEIKLEAEKKPAFS